MCRWNNDFCDFPVLIVPREQASVTNPEMWSSSCLNGQQNPWVEWTAVES